ncbi:MAG: nitroreductase family protein [Candidatus Aminicenantes bacterium]|nr:nitroreductase family protein [Candidatus Aminicenantes bacterium]
MNIYELILKRRSIRQFKQDPVSRKLLDRFVNAARLAPSAANKQPLEFVVVDDREVVKRLFPCLKWAAYIQPAGNPEPGREPAAYVVVLVKEEIRTSAFEWDSGAAIENMTLAALEKGVGSCWLISIDKKRIAEILGVPSGYLIDSVLALGYPDESPVADEMTTDSIKYWKDAEGRFHVPKRPLHSVLHHNKF